MADETVNTTTTTTQTTEASTPAEQKTTQTSNQPETELVKNETKQSTDWEDVIQRAVDRATNKLGNDNKKLRDEVEKLKKANLSDAERRQLEVEEKEKEIADREQKLMEKEHRLFAIKEIKAIGGLDDGSDASLALVDFVMADTEDEIKERVKAFSALVKRLVQSEVDRTFKSNGRTPGKGTTATEVDANAKKNSVAVNIGQRAANANKTAQTTLDYYIGGKK